ncbi:MAG: CRISPR-associated endonuclease Cas2 [Desulfurococcaceae archaeon]|jgi:CRISPR-associated protein Cas2|nr:CRISPR-associated endonuclease Cas2 [Desulfurococcaceae archaeon]
MFILVIYDISSNEMRQDLANYLKTKGFTRIQRSAFIGKPLPSVLRDVSRTLSKFIESNSDVIHLIPLLDYSIKHIIVYGKPLTEITSDKRLLVIE